MANRKTEQKTEAKGKSEDSLLVRVKKDIEQWENYARPYHIKWQDFWRLWNNERVKQQFVGDFDSFDPMTFQMVESIVDNVYGTRPKVTFLPTNRYQETDTKILQGLWDYTWDKNDMDDLIIPWGREITITGNGALFCSWEDGCMKITHVPIRDCIFDPTASCRADLRFAGYRRLAMLDELKEEKRYDADKGEWVPRYRDLEGLETYSGGTNQLDKQLKELLAGTTLADPVGQVEVVYLSYLDQVIEIANRRKVIAQYDNPYHKDAYETTAQDQAPDGQKLYDEASLSPDMAAGVASGAVSEQDLAAQLAPAPKKVTVPEIESFIPVVLQGEFKDAALLLAKGDVESFADTQEDLNDSINMMKEDIARNIRGVKVVNKTVVEPDQIEELEKAQPGSIVPISGGAANVEELSHTPMDTATLAEIQRSKQSIRDTARIDEVIQGVSDNQQKTATEIKTQVAQASSGFATKTRALESGAYQQLGEIFMKFTQIFLTEEQMVRILGKDGVEFKSFDPKQYWGAYEPKVVLESNAKAKKQEETRRILEAYSLFRGDMSLNQTEFKKLVLEKAFDMDEDDLKLLMSPDPANVAMMGGAPVGDVASGTPSLPPALPAGPVGA